MPNIIFPTNSAPGTRPQESGGRLINAYVEKTQTGAPSDVIIRRSAGLRYVNTAPEGRIHTRGFLDADAAVLWVLNNRVVAIDEDFVVTDVGELLGNDPVTLARNNAATPNNVVVTSLGCFNLFVGSPPTVFADVDLTAGPTSVCDFDGYFIWSYGDGRIFASDLNSVSVNPLSFNTEQGLFVRRVVRFAGRLYAFGDKWTGVYRNAGTSPFPLAREVTIPRGIIGTHAVAGWEAGWANELIWAGDDFNVYKLKGYTPEPISTDDVSRDLEDAIDAGLRDYIEAYVYTVGRNSFWVLTCHDLWTWEYNLATGAWNERKSHNKANWRGMKTIRVFDTWLVGDDTTGKLYEIDSDHFIEDTDPLVWHVESGVMSGFPMRTVIPRANFHITAGVGTAGMDPKVEISWSLDGGYTWGQPVLKTLGGPGETKGFPFILNSGLSRGHGIRYRFRVSDPVHVGMSGGTIDEPQQRGPG